MKLLPRQCCCTLKIHRWRLFFTNLFVSVVSKRREIIPHKLLVICSWAARDLSVTFLCRVSISLYLYGMKVEVFPLLVSSDNAVSFK